MVSKESKTADTAELVKRANEGDDSAMSELIARIAPAAKAKSVKYSGGDFRLSKEDLAQEGMVGFLYAVRKFDPSKGVPFEAYASSCIESRVLSFLARANSSGNYALSSALNVIDTESPMQIIDPVNSISAREEKIEISMFIDTCLSDFEKSVIFMRLRGYRYSEISEALGCGKKSVDNAVQRIRKKYRKFSESGT
jgi:RNA polymerase sporulation-specific sigma factor